MNGGFLLSAGVWVDGSELMPPRLPPSVNSAARLHVAADDQTSLAIFAGIPLPVPLLADSYAPPQNQLVIRRPLEGSHVQRIFLGEDNPINTQSWREQPVSPRLIQRTPPRADNPMSPLLPSEDTTARMWDIQSQAPPQRIPQHLVAAFAEVFVVWTQGPTTMAFDAQPHRPAPFVARSAAAVSDAPPGAFLVDAPQWAALVNPAPSPQPRLAHSPQPQGQATAEELMGFVAGQTLSAFAQAMFQQEATATYWHHRLNVSEAASWVMEPGLTPVSSWPLFHDSPPMPRQQIPRRLAEATSFQADTALIQLPPWPFMQDPGPPRLPPQQWRSDTWVMAPPISAGLIVVAGPFVVYAAQIYSPGAIEGDVITAD